MEKERDDLLDRDRERDERIQRLEVDLASKMSSLTEAEGAVGTLRVDLERLTVDLSQAEIVRHNYIRQLLPTMVKGSYPVAACSEEEAQAFLATAVDYDPAFLPTSLGGSAEYVAGPTLSGNVAGASTTADASNIADASDVADA
ncbi:hypothetical protein Tco_0170345 [Tanacetum coccineum]